MENNVEVEKIEEVKEDESTQEKERSEKEEETVREKGHPIFDNFLVVGICGEEGSIKLGEAVEPEVLFSYPDGKPITSLKIASFCFPLGVIPRNLRRTPSGSSLTELRFSQPQSQSHVFRLTGEDFILYGVCMTKEELLTEPPSFIGRHCTILTTKGKGTQQLPEKNEYTIVPRCYCFLSRFPFFELHIDVLQSILAHDRLSRITNGESLQEGMVAKILDTYHKKPVPEPGQTLYFQLPGDIRTKTFYCPIGDNEARLIGDWVLVPTFRALPLDHLLIFFSGLLLEKPTAVVSKNLNTLSSVVLSVIPILRPFQWQGLLIPILPNSLVEVLNAPVPFVTGVSSLQIPPEGIVIDLDAQKITSYGFSSLPKLPEGKKLYSNIAPFYRLLQNESQHHSTTSKELLDAAKSIVETMYGYSNWLASRVKTHYTNSNLELTSSRNRELLNESFIQAVTPQNREFVKEFLSTQHFSQFLSRLFQ